VTRKLKKKPLATQVVDAIEEEAAKKGKQRERVEGSGHF
jgi:hypothetical protein